MDYLLLIYKPKCLSPFVKCTLFSQGYHFVNVLPHCTGPRSCCLNTPMLKKLSSKASKKCTTLVRRSVKLRHPPPMSHSKEPASVINDPEKVVEGGVL